MDVNKKGILKTERNTLIKQKTITYYFQRSMITSIYDNKYHIKVEKWENRYIRDIMNDHQFQIPR